LAACSAEWSGAFASIASPNDTGVAPPRLTVCTKRYHLWSMNIPSRPGFATIHTES